MTSREELLTRAYGAFDLKGTPYAHYVDVPVRPTEGPREHGTDSEVEVEEAVSPLVFLTGIRSPRSAAHAARSVSEAPSVSLIVGTYGVGKTELTHQLCYYLLECRELYQTAEPLPINLALCHTHIPMLDRRVPPSGPEFAHLLFGHLFNRPYDGTWIESELLPAIRSGALFLILDGLDELASNSRQHLNFFSGLKEMLISPDDPAPRFQVVVSLRQEYLSVVDREGGKDLVDQLHHEFSGGYLPVYFLELDLFDDSRVQAYMESRGLADEWFEKVRQHKSLLIILYRPLLLRIFCDMALEPDTRKLLENLPRYRSAAQLIADYVARVDDDREVNRARERMNTGFDWDLDAMASKCLDLYRKGQEEMETGDLRGLLKPEGAAPGAVHEAATEEEVWRSIHKCPFFKRSERGVRFAHRSFFEYFIARGVSIDMRERSQEKFSAFDELVLNVDTRKFLKSMMSEEEWYERTRRSYGLDHPEEWRDLDLVKRQELERERRLLLDSMTEPEKKDKEWMQQIRTAVSTFLGRDHDQLHPRYLTYNYEAVAVFLKVNWWNEEVDSLKKDFGGLLQTRLNKSIAELEAQPTPEDPLHSPRELLVERILSIAQRLRYPWAQSYLNPPTEERLLAALAEGDTRERIKSILDEIRQTFFLRPANGTESTVGTAASMES